MLRSSKHTAALAVILLFLAPPPAVAEWPHPSTRSPLSKNSFAELVAALNAAIGDYDMNAVSKASVGAKRRGIVIACNIEIDVFRNDFAVSM